MPHIVVENLQVRYGDFTAVHSLDLDVAEGELCVLLGPSGCGKTTTMRCIAGLENPVAGSIRIAGKEVYSAERRVNVPPFRRNVGMVFQSYAIWPHRTVFQNVAFPLQMKKTSKSEIATRVEAALELVGLTGVGDRGASQLSGGQMQRVALARSLVTRPDVLLMDEPLSNLDAKLRDRLRFEIKALQLRLGLTSIYVTHDQGEAFALADQVIVMRDGRIVQQGSPREIYRSPATKFVADFLGMTNIFDVTVVGHERGRTTVRLKSGLVFEVAADADSASDLAIAIPSEGIRFADESTAKNTFQANVEVQSFLGAMWRYRVATEDGLIFDVATNEAARSHKVGETVTLSVPPESINLIPRD